MKLNVILDTYRKAAEQYLASFPTREDRRRFIETARGLLVYDDGFHALPSRKRKALLAGPLTTNEQEQEVVARIKAAIEQIAKQTTGGSDEVLKPGAQLARLITEGLSGPDVRKDELIIIERDILKLNRAITAAATSERNKINREIVADESELIKLVKKLLESIKTQNLSKNSRAEYVLRNLPSRYRRSPKNPVEAWTRGALIKWARNRKIQFTGRG